MKRWALAIGAVHDERKDESELFVYKEFYDEPAVEWAMNSVAESQLYFDSKDELDEFKGNVIEYAKGLYQEYVKKEEGTR